MLFQSLVNLAGDDILLSFDESIAAAMAVLPKGYEEGSTALQYNVCQKSCMYLFYYSTTDGDDKFGGTSELGGPGSAMSPVI